jgi:hypothetical protein
VARTLTLTTARTTPADNVSMTAALRAATNDPTAVLITLDNVTADAQKATDWTPGEIAIAQAIFDTSESVTPEVAAQREVDSWLTGRRRDVLATVALIVRRTDPAWATMTPAQKRNAVLEAADQWRDLRALVERF